MKRRTFFLPLKRTFSLTLTLLCVLSLFTACGSSKEVKEGDSAPALLTEATSEITTSEVSITLDLQGTINDTSGSRHTASISSDMTVSSSYAPMAIYVDGYSTILVDGAMSREPLSVYILQEEDDYVEYSQADSADEWAKRTLTRSEVLALPAQTGVLTDWYFFMKTLTHTDTIVNEDETESLVYTGTVDSSILNELYANNIFGSFMKSVEWLLEDDIACTFYMNAETNLPEKILLDFSDTFTVTDMVFSAATISVEYLDWNNGAEISIPKKYAVVAADADEIFYSTYFAWNLFLPFVGGDAVTGNQSSTGSSFQSNWETYQMRIDGGMTSLPFAFEDLKKLGYTVDDKSADIIIEPNQYYSGVTVNKGNDKMICTFYNDATTAQPIGNCKIGAVDISVSDQKDNSIQIYLPGEVALGITEEALLSAYGDADETVSGFSCDTHTWKGAGELQSLVAETSPSTNQVIRLCLQNIPVTGGAQNAQSK